MRALAILALLPGMALAHEGHAPLPTKGATVMRDRLMLSASASQAIGLQLGKVELAEVAETVGAVGSVELPWSQQAFVTTLVAGRIDQVLAKPGEAVKAGQPLAHVASMELESLQRSMLQALAARTYAARLFKGQQSAGSAIAGKVLLQTQTDLNQQNASFNIAWQKLRAIGLSRETLQQVCQSGESVSTMSLFSPIDGVVAMADVRPGQIVQPTEHLYHIVDTSRVWIVAKVLEADVGKVKPGLPVQCTFAMFPKRVYRGTIDHAALRLDRDRTLAVKAKLANSSQELKPGMFGRVLIELASAKQIVCPTEALILDGQSTYALVEQSPRNYQRMPVSVSGKRGKLAVITDGLFPGDKVVTVGSHELATLFSSDVESPGPVQEAPFMAATVAHGQIELPVDRQTFASVPMDGRIRRILVQHGERVSKGQVLAELDSLTFRSVQLELLQARSSYALVAQTLARIEDLGDRLARKELWKMQSERDGLRQQIASLEAQLTLAGMSVDEIGAIESTDFDDSPSDLPSVLPIRAPADGVVCKFDLVPGQVVSRQDQLFELHDSSEVWVHSYLFEQDALRVTAGQHVGVRLAADPAFQAEGRIERVDPVLVSGNRALSVWTELDNPDRTLKEGMAVTVTLGLPSVAER